MPYLHLLIILLTLLAMGNCKPSAVNSYNMPTVVKRIPMPQVPSASGMVYYEGRLFVLGDDSPNLFEIDTAATLINRWVLFGGHFPTKIPKPIKPDLEAMAIAQTSQGPRLLLFGSGSLSPQRDSLIVVDPEDPLHQQSYSLTPLYKAIIDQANMHASLLNIEGAEVMGDNLYLLNRGENLIIQLSLETLWDHLEKGGEIPPLHLFPVTLPKLDGLAAGLSGATLHPDKQSLLFTASVEQTDNWVDDGPVTGTFIGEWSLKPHENQPLLWCLPILENGVILPIKGESISCLGKLSTGKLYLVVVTDSDGGHSELLEIIIETQGYPKED